MRSIKVVYIKNCFVFLMTLFLLFLSCYGDGIESDSYYVLVSNNIFSAFWPENTGVITFKGTHYSSILGNIITPIGGMNRSRDQITEKILSQLPDSYGIETKKNCSYIKVNNNIVEKIGPFDELMPAN
jgi:hypothetical protein